MLFLSIGGVVYSLDEEWLWPLLSLCFGVLLIYHFWHLLQLECKLNGKEGVYGLGVWHTLFTLLDRREETAKRQRRQLSNTLKYFQAAAEHLPIGIVVLNQQKKIEWLNHSASTYLYLNPHTALGSVIYKQPSLESCRDFLQSEHDCCEIQLNLSHQHSTLKRYVRLVKMPFKNDTQLIIVEDITRAEQLEITRTAFVANVSHELRTPLTVVRGFLETLIDNPDLSWSERKMFIHLMQQESDRMMDLVNDLLTLSTLEDPNHREENRERVDLSELCQHIVQAGEALSAKQHHIDTQIEPHLYVNGHYKDLYQALSNLVFNAIRYTPPGGVIDIKLQAIPDANPFKPPLARFSVRDNGMGIAAEHLPHITKRFYRVDKGRSRASGGTGLGLAIAKHALANHSAELEIYSVLGEGSEFSAALPTMP